MNVLIDTAFQRDVTKIDDKKIHASIVKLISELEVCSKIKDIKNCKKLKGYKDAYRIKMGDFRVGFVYSENTIELVRILHRSKIYLFFP